jgi:hypothetical protein
MSKIREIGSTSLRIDRKGNDKETFYRPSASAATATTATVKPM